MLYYVNVLTNWLIWKIVRHNLTYIVYAYVYKLECYCVLKLLEHWCVDIDWNDIVSVCKETQSGKTCAWISTKDGNIHMLDTNSFKLSEECTNCQTYKSCMQLDTTYMPKATSQGEDDSMDMSESMVTLDIQRGYGHLDRTAGLFSSLTCNQLPWKTFCQTLQV